MSKVTCNDIIVRHTGTFGCRFECPCSGRCSGPAKCRRKEYRDRRKKASCTGLVYILVFSDSPNRLYRAFLYGLSCFGN